MNAEINIEQNETENDTGEYTVTINVPRSADHVHTKTEHFAYGPDKLFDTAVDAAIAAYAYHRGALNMFNALATSALPNTQIEPANVETVTNTPKTTKR